MPKRNLILIHRGLEYERDFREIAEKITGIDKDITVYAVASSSLAQLPALAWMWPTLVVALMSDYRLQVKRGTVLKNSPVEKLAQYEIFRKAGIPTAPMQRFRFGMTLDPLLYGEFVIIKPMDLDLTSWGAGVQLFRRQRLEQMQPRDFSSDHPIHKAVDGYLVQKFIDTGRSPSYQRVQTLFGKVLYSWRSELTLSRVTLDAPDSEIERAIVDVKGGERRRELVKDPDVLSLAEKVHCHFPDIPILGCDVIREASTQALYVLECNPGGNTWHFSSRIGAETRLYFGNARANGRQRADERGRRMLIDQYGAFDVAARILVEKTQKLAS